MARNRHIPRLRYRLRHLMVAVAVLAAGFAVVSWWINDPVGAAGFRLRYGWTSARASAASALGDMGSDGRTAVALARGLRDGELAVRQGAAQSLARIAPSAREDVLDALHEALGDEDEYVRSQVLVALGRQGPRAAAAVPEIVGLVADEGSGVRVEAARALGAIRSFPSEVVPVLVDGLRDDDVALRLACAKLLASYGPDASAAAAPALVERLDDEAGSTVQGAMKRALIALGPSREQTLALLERGQWWRYDEFRLDRETLIEALRDEDGTLRGQAMRALVPYIGAEDRVDVSLVAPFVAHEDVGVRDSAVSALSKLIPGPDEELAVEALKRAIHDKHFAVSCRAATAVWNARPGTEIAVDTIGGWLGNADSSARFEALIALERVGQRSAFVPVLATALDDENQGVRRLAAEALLDVGAGAEEAVPALCAALRDESMYVRQVAAKALGKMGPAAVEAVPALQGMLEGDDWDSAVSAVSVLGAIGPAAREAVPALSKALEHDDPSVSSAAARALGKMGEAARPALPALQTASIQIRDEQLRVAAKAALKRIEAASDGPDEHRELEPPNGA